jgi:hypothetical protein
MHFTVRKSRGKILRYSLIEGTVSCFDKKILELGLNYRRGCFLFFRGSDDFILQKVYLLRQNASLRWLNNVSCHFCQSPLITSGVNATVVSYNSKSV